MGVRILIIRSGRAVVQILFAGTSSAPPFNYGAPTKWARKLREPSVLLLEPSDHLTAVNPPSAIAANMCAELHDDIRPAELAPTEAGRKTKVHGRPASHANGRIYARYHCMLG